jgi:hypothetical protein
MAIEQYNGELNESFSFVSLVLITALLTRVPSQAILHASPSPIIAIEPNPVTTLPLFAMSSHDTYESPLSSRCASKEVLELFSARTRGTTWRQVCIVSTL